MNFLSGLKNPKAKAANHFIQNRRNPGYICLKKEHLQL